MKRIVAVILTLAMGIASLAVLTSCGKQEPKAPEGTVTRMQVDINPSIELMVDDENKVVSVTDYQKPEETGLPAANVLIYGLEGGATVVVRPSGTEPKIKTYFTTLGKDLAEAQAQKDKLAEALKPLLA